LAGFILRKGVFRIIWITNETKKIKNKYITATLLRKPLLLPDDHVKAPPPILLQRDGPYIYMSLHSHKVDDRTCVYDGMKPVHVPSGWEIAPGDADDIRVCATHPWQSRGLVFSNGDMYGTPMYPTPSFAGATLNPSKNLNFFTPENREKNEQRRQPYTGRARGEDKVWL
jgi:hypothetical protein